MKNEIQNVESHKKEVDLKHLDEHYESYINEVLPDNFHRGDVVSSNRMLGYCDAVMATCATFLALPIKSLKEIEKNETLSEFVFKIRAEIVMFFLGFIIVLTIWENMNIRATVIKRVDDFIIVIIILELLATTVLPFSLAIQGHFPYEKVSIIVTFSVLGFIQLLNVIMILYAMATPHILHIELQSWSKADLARFRNVFIAKPVLSIILLAIGGVLCLVHYVISWVFIAILTIMPTLIKLVFYILRRHDLLTKRKIHPFYTYFFKGNISKERVEVMSDAAIAIIACLLILDITTEEFPIKNNVREHGLNYELNHMKSEFFKFLTTFAMVSTLWYINHTVLHLFSLVSTVMLYLQKTFLAFTCLSPLGANMALKFATKENVNSKVGIRFASLIIFWSSIANIFILLYGLMMKKKYLHQWAKLNSFKENQRQHAYILFKTLNVPFWSLLCTLGTLGSPKVALYFLYICFIGTLASFFIGKLVFTNLVGKQTFSKDFKHTGNVNHNDNL
ncbi:endosomal/lysosomal proton channel TMEM175 [Hydra vulgaris]|uniref:endosomal/lysosomal proton channel TMEM175 n=1 Tax=Hydra vulgaris TaxID=6087 RepID=UPI001F5F4B73|nr:endosomal/lysosomal potassium channel TMEM175-like [Hydra vulgaris]